MAKTLWIISVETALIGPTGRPLYKYVLYFDDVISDSDIKNIILEIDEYRRTTYGYTDDTFCDELFDMIKDDNKKKKTYLNSFDSERFSLDIKKTNKKNVFWCDLNYNIKFNRINKYTLIHTS